MIKFKCQCGRSIKTRSEHAGRKLKCPECDAVLRVPKAPDAAEASSPSSQNAKSGEKKTRGAAQPRPKKKRRQSREATDDDAVTLEEASDADAVELEEYYDENDFADDLADDAYESYGDESAPALPTRRKKKKSKKKSSAKSAAPSNDSGGLSKKWIYTLGGIGGVVVVVLIGIVIKVMMSAGEEHAAAMAAPTEFRRFTHKHGGLAADYPDGWLLKSGGGTGGVPNWVSFENEVQEIKISVRGSISGTAISDIASSGGGLPLDLGMDETDDLAPVAGVHQYQKEKISADYDAYEETQPEKIDTGFGEGRVSDFTGKNTLSSEHGVRATLISNQFQYTVICRCPKDRMEEYRPIFRKIISSIGQQ